VKIRDIIKELLIGILMHVAEIPFENKHVWNTREIEHGGVVKFLLSVDMVI